MTDPRLEAAYEVYLKFAAQYPLHELTQMLIAMDMGEKTIEYVLARHAEQARRIVELKEPLGVGREDAQPWYTGPQKGDKNWPAFSAKLGRSLSADGVRRIHDASEKVVAMLDHPATACFDSRGLVVGHVQSGKTSNFTAVIAKAADRGYRMFIVFSGVHNALRRQTQTRLVRDLVAPNRPLWHQITGEVHDFRPLENAPSLLASQGQCLLLVVKKNSAVLRKLKIWLASAREQLENCPALVIDDEADQATVATKKINPLIRDVIDQLPRSCYVGYTATPFGNLLIDPTDDRDFYPKNFILSLPMGEGYQGPEALFGRSALDGEDPADAPTGLDMIREIPEQELDNLRPATRADIPGFAPVLSASLRQAILWFWLATAIRHARGQDDQHSSMLIHAHSSTVVHDAYAKPLGDFRREVQGALASGSHGLRTELAELWRQESGRVRSEEFGLELPEWELVSQRLPAIVRTTRIVMDHYRSNDRLDYGSEPENVIAVGGNTLSRGLTLEGLVVSVFVRSSTMYDALLQMGRWFGYRPGYADLPRIWIPGELRSWFSHLGTVEAEMRREIDRYLSEHQSPLQMAVRIRCHPQMRVTAPSRMGSYVRAAASYGGQLVESRYFRCSPTDVARRWHDSNGEAARRLLAAAAREGRPETGASGGNALYLDVPSTRVLEFVDAYAFDARATEYSAKLVRGYIEKRADNGGLLRWGVGVIGNDPTGTSSDVVLPDGRRVGRVSRARTKASADLPVADIKTLTGSRDPGIDLRIPRAPADASEAQAKEYLVTRSNLNRWRLEQRPEAGLVLLYPIDGASTSPKPDRRPLGAPVDVVWGAAFVFPEPTTGRDLAVEYDYVKADLSKVFPAAGQDDDLAEDLAILDEDMDADTDGAPTP